MPTRQRAGDRCRASPGLFPEVWNEFSGTMPQDTRRPKSGARSFIYTSTFVDIEEFKNSDFRFKIGASRTWQPNLDPPI
jgi:hypothetical protein